MSFMIFQNEKKPFQAIKTRSSKSGKIDIFSKGLSLRFGRKMAIFKTSFFQAIQARKMSFMICYNEKTPFWRVKTRSSKSRKIDIFPKGIPQGFGQKRAIFPPFFYAVQPRKKSFMTLQNEKTPFQAIKTTSTKSRKIDIFPKGLTHDFGPKIPFFHFFFSAIQTRKMSFMIFQNEKTPFQAIKTRSSKSRKIDIFLKVLTHGFGPNWPFFHLFLSLGNIAQENVFYDILQRKNAFLAYKSKKFKKSKIDNFPRGLTHGLGPKTAIFQLFLGGAIQARKMSFMIFQNEKTLFQPVKTRSSESRKSDIFQTG